MPVVEPRSAFNSTRLGNPGGTHGWLLGERTFYPDKAILFMQSAKTGWFLSADIY
jgi:hypothetical protein